MNFKDYMKKLSSMHGDHYTIFFQDDSDERTAALAELDAEIEEFKKAHTASLDEVPILSDHDSYADIMEAEEWMEESCRGMAFTPSDGIGHWSTKDGHSYEHSDVFGHKPSWATHVAWYNN